MDRRSFLSQLSLAAVGLSVPSCVSVPFIGEEPAPPNVVMLISDDQGYGDYGFMGHPVIRTPRLDQLAVESAVFTRGYVTAPLCCPSLASLITGLHPHQNKITSNDPPFDPARKIDAAYREEMLEARERMTAHIEEHPTLPTLLADKGYVSMQTGKWWQGHYRRGGFTHGMTHGDPRKGGRHGDKGLAIGRETMDPVFDFINEAKDGPFFLWFAPMMPHLPHTPPDDLLDYYRTKTDSIFEARYWAMCEWWDRVCGELLDYLDHKGLRENTLVVYICDNGWIQSKDNQNFAQRSKMSPFEGGIRTPIMLRWPGHIHPRRDNTTPVSEVDLPTTILAACNVKAPSDMQGVDLTNKKAASKRKTVFGAVYTHNAVDVDSPVANLLAIYALEGPWKLILPIPIPVQPYKANLVPSLFNVIDDPDEQNNLVAEFPGVARGLRKHIDEWWPEGSAVCAEIKLFPSGV